MDAEWGRRLDAERRVGLVTPGEERVLRAIHRDLALGYDVISEARLMSEAGASRSLVQRAKAKGKARGLLQWQRRFGAQGDRRVELPCRYQIVDVAPVEPQNEARKVQPKRKEEGLGRSVQQQLAALGFPGGLSATAQEALEQIRAARRDRSLRDFHVIAAANQGSFSVQRAIAPWRGGTDARLSPSARPSVTPGLVGTSPRGPTPWPRRP